MKKNYIAPETQVINVAAVQLLNTSTTMSVSNDTTSSQWSRGGDWEDEE